MTHKELHQKFKKMVWNPIKLAHGYDAESTFRWWCPNPENHQKKKVQNEQLNNTV